MKLLHIDSSILGADSVSRQLTAAIVDRIRSHHHDIEVSTRDLSADPVAHLTLDTFPTVHPDKRDDLHQFQAADIVVIGAPMYNFTIPSTLKAWIDRIIVNGETFAHDDNGPVGLTEGKRLIVAVASGNRYGPGDAGEGLDHVQSYLRALFGFIGITPAFIVADGIKAGPEEREASIARALTAIAALPA